MLRSTKRMVEKQKAANHPMRKWTPPPPRKSEKQIRAEDKRYKMALDTYSELSQPKDDLGW